eukprot:2960225-Rhodomonas_salina.1
MLKLPRFDAMYAGACVVSAGAVVAVMLSFRPISAGLAALAHPQQRRVALAVLRPSMPDMAGIPDDARVLSREKRC